ncbi:MAG: hypothetical protein ACI4NG_06520 [Candidatus Gallimonas sp.]
MSHAEKIYADGDARGKPPKELRAKALNRTLVQSRERRERTADRSSTDRQADVRLSHADKSYADGAVRDKSPKEVRAKNKKPTAIADRA